MTVYNATGWEALLGSPGWAAALALLAVSCVVGAVYYGLRESRLAPRGWVVLMLLRLAAVVAAGLLLVGIERRTMTETEQPSRVVLLADHSASMELPVDNRPNESPKRSEIAGAALETAAALFSDKQAVRRAKFDVAYSYVAADNGSPVEPGGSTRLGAAIERALADHTTSPLAAILVASDGGWNAGPEPMTGAMIAAKRGVPIHTLGVGPVSQPPRVGLRDLAAPARASAGDRFKATLSVAANAEAHNGQPHTVSFALQPLDGEAAAPPVFEKTTTVEIGPDGGLASTSLDVEPAAAGFYQLTAMLTPAGDDADPSDNRRVAKIELIDKPTRVLLAAGGPARDYRFLRDQLFRDDLFTCDVLLQSAGGAVTQDAGQVLTTLPIDSERWEAYDALVAIDLDWSLVDEATKSALAEWVATRGGGLVLAAGPVHTPAAVRRGFTDPLRALLPVTLRDDPLALSAAIEARREPRVVTLSSAGENTDFLRPPSSDNQPGRWSGFAGFYGEPLPAEAKPAATVLASLDAAGDDPPPLLVQQFYGAGRAVYLATAETWRLRRIDPAWFTSFHTGLLRHVSQGRLLGGAAEGALLIDRDRYDLGDTMTVRYVARSPDSIGERGPGFVRVVAPNGISTELPLTIAEGQTNVFAASLRPASVGRYEAVFFTPAGERLAANTEVTLPSLESETVVQNTKLLRTIAETCGGRYLDLSAPNVDEMLAQLAAATPSLAETTIEIGPPDEAFATKMARLSLLVMASSLLLEWLLRRAWRLA